MFGFGSKKKVEEFMSDSSKTYLTICGKKVNVDGKDFSTYETIKNPEGFTVVKLEPGIHVVNGVFESYGVKSDQTEVKLDLKQGGDYILGLWQYSPAYMEQNKDDPKMKHLCYIPMTGANKDWALICFVNKE